MIDVQEKFELSMHIRQEVDRWLKKYPPEQRQSALIPALHIVQDEQGWLSTPMMDAMAEYLKIPAINVYEVASFYGMFSLKPKGRHEINLCGSISCALRSSHELGDYIKEKLGVDYGETTSDNKFTLKEVECLGACCGGPAMLLDKKYYEHLTPEKVDDILDAIHE